METNESSRILYQERDDLIESVLIDIDNNQPISEHCEDLITLHRHLAAREFIKYIDSVNEEKFNSYLRWTDTCLQTRDSVIQFPKCPSLHQQKLIVFRFFNFYMNGKIPRGVNVTDLLYSAIMILPSWHDKSLFSEESFHELSDKTFFKYPAENDPENTQDENWIYYELSKSPITVASFPNLDEPQLDNYEFHNYTIQDSKMFAAWVNDLLKEKWHIKKFCWQIKRVAAFLALTLLRLFVKSSKQVALSMSKAKYRENLLDVSGVEENLVFSVPCSQALNLCETELNIENYNQTQMFVKIVSLNFKLKDNLQLSSGKDIKLLQVSILWSTAYHGIELLQLYHDATSFGNKQAWHSEDIQLLLTFPSTRLSWQILEFYNKSNIKSIMWARIMDRNFCRDLDPINNLNLASALSAFSQSHHNLSESELLEKKLYWIKPDFLANFALKEGPSLLNKFTKNLMVDYPLIMSDGELILHETVCFKIKKENWRNEDLYRQVDPKSLTWNVEWAELMQQHHQCAVEVGNTVANYLCAKRKLLVQQVLHNYNSDEITSILHIND